MSMSRRVATAMPTKRLIIFDTHPQCATARVVVPPRARTAKDLRAACLYNRYRAAARGFRGGVENVTAYAYAASPDSATTAAYHASPQHHVRAVTGGASLTPIAR